MTETTEYPKEGSVYRHRKTHAPCEVLCTAINEETTQKLVVYRCLETVWAKTIHGFYLRYERHEDEEPCPST